VLGLIERFTPTVVGIQQHRDDPQPIGPNRIAPYKPRSLDASVVLDLMMYAIDVIDSLVKSPMHDVGAIGRAVFSDNLDVADARIRFEDGCIANVTSRRIGLKTERTIRIFQANYLPTVC
jgi:predicted dehydrogenase